MYTTNGLILRDARPDERATIREITLAAYAQYEQVMSRAHWKLYNANVRETLDADSPAQRIVAERDGVIVGSVLLFPPEEPQEGDATPVAEWPELRLLAVAPAGRGQGVGAALLEECIRRARQTGARAIGLHTEEVMTVAKEMYERRGFVRVPAFDFWPDDEVIVMAYYLPLDSTTA